MALTEIKEARKISFAENNEKHLEIERLIEELQVLFINIHPIYRKKK